MVILRKRGMPKERTYGEGEICIKEEKTISNLIRSHKNN